MSPRKRNERIQKLEKLMRDAAAAMEFEKAAKYRDELKRLQKMDLDLSVSKQANDNGRRS